MSDGCDIHALRVERCAKSGMTINVVAIDDQPWFVVDEHLLSLSSARALAQKVPQKDRSERVLKWAVGQKRPTSLLNELGLYRVLLASKNPAAADLARWVFEEVVPSVRKSGRYRLFQEAKRLGVTLDYTEDQWEWLRLNSYLIDVIPLALAGYNSVQITQALNYNTPSGITVRKQITRLQQLGLLPEKLEPRVKQLEARITAQRPK